MTKIKSSDLNAWLKAKNKPTRVLGDVERYLLSRPREDRPTDVFHPSEIVKDDFCLRESYYLLNGATPKKDRPNLRLQNIFDEGHEIHAKWQRRFEEMGVLWGKWDNGEATKAWWGLPEDGPALNRRYREVPVRSRLNRVSGHGDGLLIGLGDPAWLEIKSVGEGTIRAEAPHLMRKNEQDAQAAWCDINRPFPSHLRQTLFYLDLCALTYPQFEVNEAVVIYEWKATQAPKEFVVQRDPDITAPFWEKTQIVLKAIDLGKPPKCTTEGCKKHQKYEEA